MRRWSSADDAIKLPHKTRSESELDLAGEKLRRILFETGVDADDDDWKSSNKFDLFPHNIADMMCRKKIPLSDFSDQKFLFSRSDHADL